MKKHGADIVYLPMSSYGSPLSIPDLASKLIQNGLLCPNADERRLIEQRLHSVSYHRLEEYSWPYRNPIPGSSTARTSQFKSGCTIGLIWSTYIFDRRLRMLLMDAIERFEVAWKNNVTQVLVEASGVNNPQTDLTLLPKFAATDMQGVSRMERWLKKANEAFAECKDVRIEHCRQVHGTTDVVDLPLWILMELLTFGAVRKLYDAMDTLLQQEVATKMGAELGVLNGSVKLLHQVRNCCAHHSRVWNRKWSKPCKNQQTTVPLFSEKPQESKWYCRLHNGNWKIPAQAGGWLSLRPADTAFVFLLCGYWLNHLAHTSDWKTRVERVVQPHGSLSRNATMAGFVDGWNKHPLWIS